MLHLGRINCWEVPRRVDMVCVWRGSIGGLGLCLAGSGQMEGLHPAAYGLGSQIRGNHVLGQNLARCPRATLEVGVVAPWLPPGQLHGISSTSPSSPCCPACCLERRRGNRDHSLSLDGEEPGHFWYTTFGSQTPSPCSRTELQRVGPLWAGSPWSCPFAAESCNGWAHGSRGVCGVWSGEGDRPTCRCALWTCTRTRRPCTRTRIAYITCVCACGACTALPTSRTCTCTCACTCEFVC